MLVISCFVYRHSLTQAVVCWEHHLLHFTAPISHLSRALTGQNIPVAVLLPQSQRRSTYLDLAMSSDLRTHLPLPPGWITV